LTDRLVADKDFQELSISAYHLISKVQNTRSGVIFQKYFQKTITDAELIQLLKSIGYGSKDEFTSELKKMYLHKIELIRRFAELTITDNKGAIESAAKRVVEIAAKPNPHTISECWLLYLTMLTACSQGCEIYAENWENCMMDCTIYVSSIVSTCFLLAD